MSKAPRTVELSDRSIRRLERAVYRAVLRALEDGVVRTDATVASIDVKPWLDLKEAIAAGVTEAADGSIVGPNEAGGPA